jgi:hypothetical protein
MKKLILTLIIMSYLISIISAGTTTFNQPQNFTIGECWRNRQITEINEYTDLGYTIYWIRGCEIKNETPVIPEVKCEKISGDGNINIFVYSDFYGKDRMIGFGNWVLITLNNETPFNETTYTLYYEKDKFACRESVNEKQMDFRIGTGYAWGHRAWGEPGHDGQAGDVIFYNYEEWRFLLMHELAHVYTGLGHTEDGSILDLDGGNQEYNKMEINLIRNNLM